MIAKDVLQQRSGQVRDRTNGFHNMTVQEFVDENEGLLTRMLAHGDSETRGYALAMFANGGSDDDIDRVQEALEDLKSGDES